MRITPTVLPLIALLAITACAPATNRPQATAEEIRAEQEWQKEAAMNNPFPPIVEPVYPTRAMEKRLQIIASRISPQAIKLCYDVYHGMRNYETCNFSLELKGTRGVNAYADGSKIVISTPMMVFAQNDTHLALVLAHEYAHNIMEHQEGLGNTALFGALLGSVADVAAASQGASTGGTFGKIGGEVALRTYSPSYEAEADYIALYILARANYPIEQAPAFWRAMAQYEPEGIYSRTTHPTNAERFVAMRKTIDEIRAKQRAKQPLLPNIRKDA